MVEGDPPGASGKDSEHAIQRWGYDTHFKYYLYRMGVLGNEGVDSITNFPERIELNEKWHEALNRIKKESNDGRERWIPVGMRADRTLDFVPTTTVKGDFISAKTLTADQVKEKYGIVHHIGEIHSHPSDIINRFGVNLIVATRLVKDFEGFSPEDLHFMVSREGLPMTGVVEKSNNYFAFRTAETRDLPTESPLRDSRAFSSHWSRKYGGRYLGESHLSFWASPRFSVRELNMGIAEAYNLALYKGKPGADLVREYPKP